MKLFKIVLLLALPVALNADIRPVTKSIPQCSRTQKCDCLVGSEPQPPCLVQPAPVQ